MNQQYSDTATEETSSVRGGKIRGVALAVVVVAVFGVVALAKLQRANAAAEFSTNAAGAKPYVSTVVSTAAPESVDLVLPGNTEAVVVSDIFARASGYVKSRFADIGDRVRSGQTLAIIESPELDQDLARARATLEESRAAWRQAQANLSRAEESVLQANAVLDQSQANEVLAQKTADRWTRLVEKGVLPRQEGDERTYAYNARKAETAASVAGIKTAQASVKAMQSSVVATEATIRANEANVARLERMVSFEKVVAPFDGIITERVVEQGDLISADGAAGGHKLFAIAQASTLRVKVNVPQTFSAELKDGQEAQVVVRERPGQIFTGKVARTADALDASSRTLRVEVQIDNKAGLLLPGMYSEVKFGVHRAKPATLISADALLTNAQGTRVATVDPQGRVHLHNVEIGRDLGAQIEVVAGLEPNQALILNPAETLTDGQQVIVGERQ